MLSIVDLGIVHRVDVVDADGPIRVEILPTFVGCPALELIRSSIAERLACLRAPGRGHGHLRGPVDLGADQPAGRAALRGRHRAARRGDRGAPA